MATITPKAITTDGVAPTWNDASAGGDKVKPGENVFISVKNGGAAPLTVTITPPGETPYGVANPPKTFTVPAAGEMDIPILPAYGNPQDSGLASIGWDVTTSVTFAARRI